MKVTVYSTQTCPYCHQLKHFLDDNKIKYEDIDVSENQEKAQEMIKKSGQMGVPVTDIDGDIVLGFDVETLKQKLNIK